MIWWFVGVFVGGMFVGLGIAALMVSSSNRIAKSDRLFADRLIVLLERCLRYLRHSKTCPYDPAAGAEHPCECGLGDLLAGIYVVQVDGWVKAKAGDGHA